MIHDGAICSKYDSTTKNKLMTGNVEKLDEWSVIWIAGFSGAGKTILANKLITSLNKSNSLPILLDGDILRKLLKVPHKTMDSHTLETRIKLALKYAQI